MGLVDPGMNQLPLGQLIRMIPKGVQGLRDGVPAGFILGDLMEAAVYTLLAIGGEPLPFPVGSAGTTVNPLPKINQKMLVGLGILVAFGNGPVLALLNRKRLELFGFTIEEGFFCPPVNVFLTLLLGRF